MQFTLLNLIDNKLGKEKDDNNSLYYMAINIRVKKSSDGEYIDVQPESDLYEHIVTSAEENANHTAVLSDEIVLHLPNKKKIGGIQEAVFELRNSVRLILLEAGPKDKMHEMPRTDSNTALMSTGDTAGGQEIPPKKDKSSFRKLTPEEKSRSTGVHTATDSASAAKQGLDKYFNRP